MSGYWLGVDLGGTKILSGLFDENLKLLARSKQPTSAEGGAVGVFGRIVQGVEELLAEHQTHTVTAEFQGVGRPMPVLRIGGTQQ